jgi:hypothetical protein
MFCPFITVFVALTSEADCRLTRTNLEENLHQKQNDENHGNSGSHILPGSGRSRRM